MAAGAKENTLHQGCRITATVMLRISTPNDGQASMTKYLFLVSYVLVVFGFALLYTVALPERSFFHSSLTREHSFRVLSSRVDNVLGDALFANAAPARFTVGDVFYVVATPVHRGNVWIEGQTIRARYYFDIYEDRSRGTENPVTVVTGPAYVCDIIVEVSASEVFPRYEAPEQPVIISWRIASTEPPLTREAVADVGHWSFHAGEPMKFIGQGEYNDLVRFVLASRGIPSGVANQFFRMLYFSIATIATIGYGDIVPVSDWARGLAGIEAFLGIVLIGAFINSMARR